MLLLLLSLLSLSLNQESHNLHRAKLSLSDPNDTLATWTLNDYSAPNPCLWYGVICDNSSSVVSLDLSSLNISGPFPLVLCQLQNLTFISLYNNSINSTLPEKISKCWKLRHLDLSENYLAGELPGALANITTLEYLDLSGNNFSGQIPASFGQFKQLKTLSLIGNSLSREIPAELGNISSLKQLNLSYNPFSPSPIPPELGKLTNLEILWLTECNLKGPIPDSLSRLTRLTNLDLAMNKLTGPIPSWLTGLTSLIQIELYNNSLTGELPTIGWGNLTRLEFFDASMNNLTGTIPNELCSLNLKSFSLYGNDFYGKIPKNLANISNLYELKLFGNRFSGELPQDLGKNSPLKLIDVSNNELTGELPPGLCVKGVFEELLVINNKFSGEIPAGLGECKSLTRVRLGNNKFSGKVPEGMWGLPRVSLLELVNNSFTGEISKNIIGAKNLSSFILSGNKFSGEIPEEIGQLGNLVEFSGSGNGFTGSLPDSILKLSQLGKLNLRNNELNGEIPKGVGNLTKLNELNLANNDFSGVIPEEIGNLSVLNYLDLSGNNISGEIPIALQDLRLNELNLSNNNFLGEIPPLYDKEIYETSFLNNPGLHGETLRNGKNGDTNGNAWLIICISIFVGLVFVTGVVFFYFSHRNFKKLKNSKGAIEESKLISMSFHKLAFNEHEILNCLNEDNVIGSGSSGKVYKAVLSKGEVVAVKKLEKSRSDDMEKGEIRDDVFEAEVGTLGKIRHKNIVKLLCCCSTKDHKLLVYEYLSNGSLGDVLHSSKSGILGWPMRFKIAFDSAEGLSYLHHDCVPPIVHRDIKSNNILLDGEFGARVADFGVAKAVDSIGNGARPMSIIAGSCSYIAPEYGYTLRVNEKSDIYSFGVVVLELVTGKRPTGPEFVENNLVKWVCTNLDKKGIDSVIDPKLDSCFKKEIYKVLNIGLLCTSQLPINRPSMRRVVKMLEDISGKSCLKDGKFTPYYTDDVYDQGSAS